MVGCTFATDCEEPVSASTHERIRLAYFSRSVVSAVAHSQRLYDAAGLAVTEHAVPSSPAQFRGLRDGEYDLALTSPDNVAAYRLTDANPLGERLDARILLGIDRGMGLSILAAPHVSSLTDLAGRTVGVDVPESGFALALFEVLSSVGLQRDRDYTLVSLGSTPRRRTALLDGRCDATLLNAGHDIAAELAGCRRLARITDTISPYLGTVLAATDAWLERAGDLVRRFAGVWLAATRTVLDPTERDTVQSLLGELLELPPSGVAAAYDVLTSPNDGLVRDGVVDLAALRTVLALRARHAGAGLRADETTAAGLVDPRVLELLP
jgi:ABC-type nitrate/sulfonate/bicarbonate transport system substrate-binding protein